MQHRPKIANPSITDTASVLSLELLQGITLTVTIIGGAIGIPIPVAITTAVAIGTPNGDPIIWAVGQFGPLPSSGIFIGKDETMPTATTLKGIDHAILDRNFCRGLAQTNLDACFIFTELAKRELETGMRGQAERSFGRAKSRYEATRQLLKTVENDRNEVEQKIEDLGEKLDFLRKELNRAA